MEKEEITNKKDKVHLLLGLFDVYSLLICIERQRKCIQEAPEGDRQVFKGYSFSSITSVRWNVYGRPLLAWRKIRDM